MTIYICISAFDSNNKEELLWCHNLQISSCFFKGRAKLENTSAGLRQTALQ